jgi:hypothetical protein
MLIEDGTLRQCGRWQPPFGESFMKPPFSVLLPAGLAVAAVALLPSAGSAEAPKVAANQHLEIDNRAPGPVTVRVLHSDGSLQEQETVGAGSTYRFTFEWCFSCCGHNKHRTFEVTAGSTLRATGELYMSTKKVYSGPDGPSTCDENNQMTVKDANANDAWAFATSSENGHRTAVLTVTRTAS